MPEKRRTIFFAKLAAVPSCGRAARTNLVPYDDMMVNGWFTTILNFCAGSPPMDHQLSLKLIQWHPSASCFLCRFFFVWQPQPILESGIASAKIYYFCLTGRLDFWVCSPVSICIYTKSKIKYCCIRGSNLRVNLAPNFTIPILELYRFSPSSYVCICVLAKYVAGTVHIFRCCTCFQFCF